MNDTVNGLPLPLLAAAILLATLAMALLGDPGRSEAKTLAGNLAVCAWFACLLIAVGAS